MMQKYIHYLNNASNFIHFLNINFSQLIYIKLKYARELLGMTQSQLADATNLSQRDISMLESGKKEFIPTGYIQYLNKMNIDLRSLFDDELEVKKINEGNENNSALKFASETITAQRLTIDLLMSRIASLESK